MDRRICPQCDKENGPDAVWCWLCGTPLVRPRQWTSPPPIVPGTEAPPSPPRGPSPSYDVSRAEWPYDQGYGPETPGYAPPAEPWAGHPGPSTVPERSLGGMRLRAYYHAATLVEDAKGRARDAVLLAIFGLFCVGFVIGPIAIVQAARARRTLVEYAVADGQGVATAGIVLGAVT